MNSIVVIVLHETIATKLEPGEINPTDAVLTTERSIRFVKISEQELRRSLRKFRHDPATVIDKTPTDDQRTVFEDSLRERATDLEISSERVTPNPTFKKWMFSARKPNDIIDGMRLSGKHVTSGHGELVRELYQERLETIAEENQKY